MKSLILLLLKRNALVALVFALVFTGIRLVPSKYLPPGIFIPVLFIGSIFWANSILIRRGHAILAVVLSVLLVPILGFPLGVGSFLVGRSFREWEYRAQGLEMVEGCNGGAANTAFFEVHQLEDLLGYLTNTPNADPNQIARLQRAYALAQEKARILDEDCGRRGHCDSYPWKTNWGTIKETVAATEEAIYR